MLVNAAMDAMRQWRFEPAVAESSGIVEFKFQPQEDERLTSGGFRPAPGSAQQRVAEE